MITQHTHGKVWIETAHIKQANVGIANTTGTILSASISSGEIVLVCVCELNWIKVNEGEDGVATFELHPEDEGKLQEKRENDAQLEEEKK